MKQILQKKVKKKNYVPPGLQINVVEMEQSIVANTFSIKNKGNKKPSEI